VDVTHVFAALPVTDLAASREWYERLFGRPPDMLPTEGEAVWRLADGASVYVVVDPERAGSGLMTLAAADLVTRGVAASPGPRGRVVLTDPDGNRITLFEPPHAR
jgi:glyoxylase I family protein